MTDTRPSRGRRRPGPRAVLASAAIAFLLHWTWETLHGPAYVETSGPLWWRVWHCLPMAVTDAAWTVGLVVALHWIGRRARMTTATRRVCLVAAGALSAVIVERLALSAERWHYAPSMPLVPGIDVGWWPLLQMAVIPLVVDWYLGRRRRSGRATVEMQV